MLWIGTGLVVGVILLLLLVTRVFTSILAFPETFPCDRPDQLELYYFCGPPSEQDLTYEDVEFHSKDGTVLRGWWIPAPSRKVVVFAHGRNSGRWMASRFLRPLHDAGFNVLTFDFRAHAGSDGDFSSLGFHEQEDLIAAIDFAAGKNMERIGLAGYSMGGATGILAMARDERVQAGLFESAFANVSDQIADNAASMGVPRWPLVPLVLAHYAYRGNMDLTRMNPEDVIGSIAPRPVLLIHGDQDPVISIEHGYRLLEAAGEPRDHWWIPGGSHVNSTNMDRARAEGIMVEFFQRYL